MSDTRPPITAGPIERAFRFLKRTSVRLAGVGVTEDDNSRLDEDEAGGDGLTIGGCRRCVLLCRQNRNRRNPSEQRAAKSQIESVIGCRLYLTPASLRRWKWRDNVEAAGSHNAAKGGRTVCDARNHCQQL